MSEERDESYEVRLRCEAARSGLRGSLHREVLEGKVLEGKVFEGRVFEGRVFKGR